MKIYGLEKMSVVDYAPYCSAVVFTGGCNFRCPFCHNGGLVEKNVTPLDENDVFDYLEKRKKLLDAVVVSGGEPTLNADLPEFVKRLKDMGFKVKLDTNGTNFDMLKNLIKKKLIDYVAMDIKNSPNKYSATAGVKKIVFENIEKSANLLKSGVIDYEFRTTLLEGFHDEESMKEMGEFLSGAEKIYLQKFVDADGVIEKGLKEVDYNTALKFKSILEKYVKNVFLRGY